MKTTIVVLVILGLVAAMSAVLLVNLLPQLMAKENDKQNQINVLVATRAIPAYTDLTQEDFEVTTMDISDANDFYKNTTVYIKDPVYLVGKTTAAEIAAGQAITQKLIITDPDLATIRKALKPGMRAYPIRLSQDQIVGGLLTPNCFVDVLVTSTTRDRSGGVKGEAVSKTFLERIKVIAVKGALETQNEADDQNPQRRSGGGWTVTLLVNTAAEAEALQLATTKGEISLTLRNPTDEEPVNSKGTVWDSSKIGIMGEFFDESVQPDRNQSNDPAKPGPTTRIVEVIKGASSSELKVPATQQPQEPPAK